MRALLYVLALVCFVLVCFGVALGDVGALRLLALGLVLVCAAELVGDVIAYRARP